MVHSDDSWYVLSHGVYGNWIPDSVVMVYTIALWCSVDSVTWWLYVRRRSKIWISDIIFNTVCRALGFVRTVRQMWLPVGTRPRTLWQQTHPEPILMPYAYWWLKAYRFNKLCLKTLFRCSISQTWSWIVFFQKIRHNRDTVYHRPLLHM